MNLNRDTRRSNAVALDVARLTKYAVADSSGADPSYLDGYLDILQAVCAADRRLARHELDTRRSLGATAAEQGTSLRALVDLYLSATWLAWRDLHRAGAPNAPAAAERILRAANDAIVALAEGYETAQRLAIRHEEALRREFIDDLLHGGGDMGRLAEQAARFGLSLAGLHAVAVTRADTPFAEADEATRRIERALLTRMATHEVLVTTKDELLVCVGSGGHSQTPSEFIAHLDAALGHNRRYQVGVGRSHPGPGGIARSYDEARAALDLADRLRLSPRVLHAADLLVFQVLFRDRVAITDLVATVLTPLTNTRGGAQPLVDTLAAYFTTGSAAAAARQLHVSVRTVTYRLNRIRQLTGHDPTDPAQRFTLETAILGARLLNWPAQPLYAPA